MSKNDRPLPYSDDVESIPVEEAEDIQRVLEALKIILMHGQAKSGEFRADVHVKTIGYALGQLQVLPDLPGDLAQGLFEHPRSFSAIVRFSNGASQSQPDALPDARGLAIKVLGVERATELVDHQRGPSQDFVMINHPVFFARNVKDYLRFEHVLAEADGNTLATFKGALTNGDWNPLHWHWKEMLTIAGIAGHLPTHPAGNTYYSMAPIRYGNYVAKYRVVPVGDRQDSYLELLKRLGTESDGLRLALEETLSREKVEFAFQVQLRTSETSMPIEDPTVLWREEESPFRTVAHLVLPQQEITSLRQQTSYKNTAFNVWHALAAHRPLGGINRLRRWAYLESSNWRRQKRRMFHRPGARANSMS